MKTGSYYDPICNGQGLDIIVRDNKTLAIWYTVDSNTEDAGILRWYIARGQPDNMKLLTTRGGTFYEPTKYTEFQIGTAALKDEYFVYNSEDHGRGAIKLRLIQEGLDGSGMYYDPDLKGSGFSVMRYPNNRLAMNWFTYRKRLGKQAWFSCQGKPESMKIKQYVEGDFRYPNGYLIDIGHAALTEDNRFTYDFRNLDGTVSGVQKLELLF